MGSFIRITLTWTAFFALASGSVLTGCTKEKHDETEYAVVDKAAQCLSKIDQKTAGTEEASTAVDGCISTLNNIKNKFAAAKASRLKCAAEGFRAGHNDNSYQTAMTNSLNAEKHKKLATHLAGLAVNSTANADKMYQTCKATGSAELTYVATLVRMGTYMEAAGISSGAGSIVDDCLANSKSCRNAKLGEMLSETAGQFCEGANMGTEFCKVMGSDEVTKAKNDQEVIDQFLAKINF